MTGQRAVRKARAALLLDRPHDTAGHRQAQGSDPEQPQRLHPDGRAGSGHRHRQPGVAVHLPGQQPLTGPGEVGRPSADHPALHHRVEAGGGGDVAGQACGRVGQRASGQRLELHTGPPPHRMSATPDAGVWRASLENGYDRFCGPSLMCGSPNRRSSVPWSGEGVSSAATSGWCRSNAGRSERIRGMDVEVVPRRRAGGGPLQRGAVAPRVVGLDQRRGAPGLPDVVQERQRRGAEQERAGAGDLVHPGEAVLGQVVGVAARHARSTPSQCWIRKVVWKPMNSIQKWILPSVSSSIRPVSLGHQK